MNEILGVWDGAAVTYLKVFFQHSRSAWMSKTWSTIYLFAVAHSRPNSDYVTLNDRIIVINKL
jgi:hypothetical protein